MPRRGPGDELAHRLRVVVAIALPALLDHVARGLRLGGMAVGREFHAGIEPQFRRRQPRRDNLHALHIGQMHARKSGLRESRPAGAGEGFRIGQFQRAIDKKKRQAVDRDRPRIACCLHRIGDHRGQRGVIIKLLDQQLARAAIPMPRPVLIGPAEAELNVDLRMRPQHLQRAIQQPPRAEIIVIDHPAIHAITRRQTGLRGQRLRQAEIVKTQIAGQMRLIMPLIARHRPRHIGPFREALAPPEIVLRCGVELRQEECQHPHPIHPPQRLAPAFGQLLLIARRQLPPPRLALQRRGDAEVMHHHRPMHIADPPTRRPQTQAEIDILAIGGRVRRVEQIASDRHPPHHQRRPGAIRHRAVSAEPGFLRVGKQPGHPGFARGLDIATRLLQPPIRIDQLRPHRPQMWVGVQGSGQMCYGVRGNLGVVVQQQHVIAGAGRECRIARGEEAEIFGMAHQCQPRHLGQLRHRLFCRCVIGHHNLRLPGHCAARQGKQTFGGHRRLIERRDQHGDARCGNDGKAEFRQRLARIAD